jgi:ribosome-binding protein aMBF1 (putative translation factor)
MLVKWRNERGWSQKELARHVGLSDQIICYYEAGDRRPSAKVREKFHRLFSQLRAAKGVRV